MSIHYEGHGVTVHHGDCLDVLRTLPDASVDAVVTDPPYGLEFMGKDWDSFKPASSRGPGAQFANGSVGGYEGKPMPRYGKRWTQRRCDLCGHVDGGASPCRCPEPSWSTTTEPGTPRFASTFQDWCLLWTTECLRVLKPGGHLLAFGGTRTWHRLACAIEDAGFEIRDTITWLYGSGFPKSLDVGKAIDKAADAEREVVGRKGGRNAYLRTDIRGGNYIGGSAGTFDGSAITVPAAEDAARWDGWGTALKPASEPIVVARKPLAGTVAQTVLVYGTGALNIAATRVATDWAMDPTRRGWQGRNLSHDGGAVQFVDHDKSLSQPHTAGRWPSNVVLTHPPTCGEDCAEGCPVAELDAQSGERSSGSPVKGSEPSSSGGKGIYGEIGRVAFAGHSDSGGASRFFPTFRYEAKADATERPRAGAVAHPTVKPLDLMRWLVRLVTPPGGLVLDPFAGSGTTAEACLVEGFRCVTIEREADYLPLIVDRITKRADPVANLTAKAERGEDVDLGLFGLLEDGAA